MLRKTLLILIVIVVAYLIIIGIIGRDWEPIIELIGMVFFIMVGLSIVTTVLALLEWKEHRSSDSKPSILNIWKDKWHQVNGSRFLVIVLAILAIKFADWIWSSWFSKYQ